MSLLGERESIALTQGERDKVVQAPFYASGSMRSIRGNKAQGRMALVVAWGNG